MKKVGGTFLAIPIAKNAAADDESDDSKRRDGGDDESREVLYDDEDVSVVKFNKKEYSIRGNFSSEEHRKLIEKYVWSDEDEVSTQTHSDSGSDQSAECVTINGVEWGLRGRTEAWSQADNGMLTFEGSASASSYADPYVGGCYEYSSEADEISITSTVGGTYRKNVAHISASPGYSVSYENAEATLSGSRSNESSYSLHHHEDAIVMEARDCWDGAYQDDAFEFSIENKDHVLGTYVSMDVGHCL